MLGVRADEKLEGHCNTGAEPSNWGVKSKKEETGEGATHSVRAAVFSIY